MDRDEVYEPISDNEILNDITNIFRDYWLESALEKEEQVILDSKLTSNLYDYLLKNKLTKLTRNELEKTSFEEVKKVIDNQDAYSRSFYLNETYGIKIWAKQKEKEYTIALPSDTLTITIVFIEDYLLKGAIDFNTMGSSQDGGWASNYENKLFCHKDEYSDLESELFRFSFLKHEANHFVDIEKYPNLSYADLEYRSKLIELMYVNDRAQLLISNFINAASDENRNKAHAYANHTIISHLSGLIFGEEYVTDLSSWKTISNKQINNVAKQLYNQSNQLLSEDTNISVVI